MPQVFYFRLFTIPLDRSSLSSPHPFPHLSDDLRLSPVPRSSPLPPPGAVISNEKENLQPFLPAASSSASVRIQHLLPTHIRHERADPGGGRNPLRNKGRPESS